MKSNFSRSGFTLMELMVAVALIAILMGIVLVSLDGARKSSRSVADLDQQRAFPKATISYSYDHKGRLLHPCTMNPGDSWLDSGNLIVGNIFPASRRVAYRKRLAESAKRLWVHTNEKDLDPGGWRVCTRSELLNDSSLSETLLALDSNLPPIDWTIETADALKEGAAWEYLGSLRAYKSPIDPTPRLRSYSLNSYVGVALCAEDFFELNQFWGILTPCLGSGPTGMPNFKAVVHSTETMSRIPNPAKTFYSIGEEDQNNFHHGVPGINFNGWVIPPVPSSFSCATWWNLPAAWEGKGINISHVDGSVEQLRVEPETMEIIGQAQSEGDGNAELAVSNYPETADIYDLMRERLLPSLLPQ